LSAEQALEGKATLAAQVPRLFRHNESPQELEVTNTAKRLVLWFVISGVVGILIAVVLDVFASYRDVNPYILLLLWPPSSLGLADPSSPSDKIILGVVEFGGNFIIYGVIGIFLGMVAGTESGRS
jgi:hypothetical protein